jgi:hypothetical protein
MRKSGTKSCGAPTHRLGGVCRGTRPVPIAGQVDLDDLATLDVEPFELVSLVRLALPSHQFGLGTSNWL